MKDAIEFEFTSEDSKLADKIRQDIKTHVKALNERTNKALSAYERLKKAESLLNRG